MELVTIVKVTKGVDYDNNGEDEHKEMTVAFKNEKKNRFKNVYILNINTQMLSAKLFVCGILIILMNEQKSQTIPVTIVMERAKYIIQVNPEDNDVFTIKFPLPHHHHHQGPTIVFLPPKPNLSHHDT